MSSNLLRRVYVLIDLRTMSIIYGTIYGPFPTWCYKHALDKTGKYGQKPRGPKCLASSGKVIDNGMHASAVLLQILWERLYCIQRLTINEPDYQWTMEIAGAGAYIHVCNINGSTFSRKGRDCSFCFCWFIKLGTRRSMSLCLEPLVFSLALWY